MQLTDCTLETIEAAMRTHEQECGQEFHRQCREFLILAQWYIARGGRVHSFDPYHHAPIMNEQWYVLTPDSVELSEADCLQVQATPI